jgi:tetratricopeptide (TPR) repeat protein
MLCPYSTPLAYREDLRLHPGRESFGEQDDMWILIAHTIERMADVSPADRAVYARRVGDGLSETLQDGERKSEPVPILSPSVRKVLAHLRAIDRPEGIDELFHAGVSVASDMEDAGVFHLAFSTLGHLRLALPEASARFHGWALANQARIARQLGEMESAAELYSAAEELARSHDVAEVAARASYGMGGLALMRGNLPRARTQYERALATAREASSEALVGLAHRGLLVVNAKAGAFDDAIRHGWHAFERASGDPASQAELLANIASVCFDCGHYDASFAAFVVAALWGRILRVSLPSLAGAALAAAHLGRREHLAVLTQRINRDLSEGAPPYESAQVLLDLARAYEEIRDPAANEYASRARSIGIAHQYFEIVHAAREITDRLLSRVRAQRRTPVELSEASETVLSSISALADDTCAYETIAGSSGG